MLHIKYTTEYYQSRKNLETLTPDIEKIISKHTRWFQHNPQDERLHDHELHGKMRGRRAFSITDDIRIVYVRIGKHTVRFLAIGRHREVYKK